MILNMVICIHAGITNSNMNEVEEEKKLRNTELMTNKSNYNNKITVYLPVFL